MADELGEATRALKRALTGQGHVIRTVGLKGFPDFIVAFESHPKTAFFIELKHDNHNIHTLQARTIDDLHRAGLVSLLLNYTAKGEWWVYYPPFLNERMQLRSLKQPDAVLGRLSGEGLLGGWADERVAKE